MLLLGIDEAGRGCLAGPLCVAGVILHKSIDGLADSKKLSIKKRNTLFEKIISNSTHKIIFTDAKTIDEIGLSKAIKNSLIAITTSLKYDKAIFDGNTTLGVSNLEWMIKADTKVAEVSAASILAKVSRDRYMLEVDKEFPIYQFAKHKGYGTKLHRELIREHGYIQEHRKSFKIKSLI